MLHPTIEDNIWFRLHKRITKNKKILVYLFIIYGVCYKKCINLDLEIEIVYKFYLNSDMYQGGSETCHVQSIL